MQELASLAGIVGALALGVISPDPSFVMVARVGAPGSLGCGASVDRTNDMLKFGLGLKLIASASA